jgi:peptidoglycan biosynthesis protein MviN/MurJ (putative lipid II flippase)
VRRSSVDAAAPPIYALAGFGLIMAPSLALKMGADRGGMVEGDYADLVLASAVVGSVHAVVAWARLRGEERRAVDRLNMWIAALNALIVLALGSTVLLVLVLHSFPDEHSTLAESRYPVAALWVGVQFVAVALAELTGRALFRWLEPEVPAPPGPVSGWSEPVGERLTSR